MNSFHLQTQRLNLRPFIDADVDDLHELWIAPEVRRYLWDDQIVPKEKVTTLIEESRNCFQKRGSGLWAVYHKPQSPLIGFGGYWLFHQPPQLELLYGIAPSYWGQGLATELARGLIEYGFEVLRFDRINASTDAANKASIRVMQKAGLKFDKTESNGVLDTIYYSTTRARLAKPLSHDRHLSVILNSET